MNQLHKGDSERIPCPQKHAKTGGVCAVRHCKIRPFKKPLAYVGSLGRRDRYPQPSIGDNGNQPSKSAFSQLTGRLCV